MIYERYTTYDDDDDGARRRQDVYKVFVVKFLGIIC